MAPKPAGTALGSAANPKKLADELRRQAGEAPKGKRVRLRATARGQYGRPIPKVIDPGEVFFMQVDDLIPHAKGRKGVTGLLLDSMKIGGVEYSLPSWAEDANKSVEVEEEEGVVVADGPGDPGASDGGDSVI